MHKPEEILFLAQFEVPNHSSKKNGKQISLNKATGRRFLRSNDKVLFAKRWIIQKLIVEKLKQRIDMITDDVIAEFTFFFPESVFFTKTGSRSKKLNDLSNLYENIQDCLQEAKIIENDTNIVNHGNSHRRPIKDNKYWIRIKLTRPKDSYFAKLIE